MTIYEASEKYHIPIKILQEYESWGLCSEVKKVMGSWHYDESDIERLSMIMTPVLPMKKFISICRCGRLVNRPKRNVKKF